MRRQADAPPVVPGIPHGGEGANRAERDAPPDEADAERDTQAIGVDVHGEPPEHREDDQENRQQNRELARVAGDHQKDDRQRRRDEHRVDLPADLRMTISCHRRRARLTPAIAKRPAPGCIRSQTSALQVVAMREF